MTKESLRNAWLKCPDYVITRGHRDPAIHSLHEDHSPVFAVYRRDAGPGFHFSCFSQ